MGLTECTDSSEFVLCYLFLTLISMLLSHLAWNVPIAQPILSPSSFEKPSALSPQEAFLSEAEEKNDLLDKPWAPSSPNKQILSAIGWLAPQLLPTVGLSAYALLVP